VSPDPKLRLMAPPAPPDALSDCSDRPPLEPAFAAPLLKLSAPLALVAEPDCSVRLPQ